MGARVYVEKRTVRKTLPRARDTVHGSSWCDARSMFSHWDIHGISSENVHFVAEYMRGAQIYPNWKWSVAERNFGFNELHTLDGSLNVCEVFLVFLLVVCFFSRCLIKRLVKFNSTFDNNDTLSHILWRLWATKTVHKKSGGNNLKGKQYQRWNQVLIYNYWRRVLSAERKKNGPNKSSTKSWTKKRGPCESGCAIYGFVWLNRVFFARVLISIINTSYALGIHAHCGHVHIRHCDFMYTEFTYLQAPHTDVFNENTKSRSCALFSVSVRLLSALPCGCRFFFRLFIPFTRNARTRWLEHGELNGDRSRKWIFIPERM